MTAPADDDLDTASDTAPGLDSGPIIGRRRKEQRRASFTLVTYDPRDRESHHPLTARVDIDASSVFGFMSPKISSGERVGALRDFLLRALVDDDGIGRFETVVAVVPDPTSPSTKDDDGDPADRTYVPVDSVDPDTWRNADVRYRVGDHTVWDTYDEAVTHGRTHGSSLRRFVAIMDDDALIVEQTALEEIVDFVTRQGADRPTKRSASSSRSRTRKGR